MNDTVTISRAEYDELLSLRERLFLAVPLIYEATQTMNKATALLKGLHREAL